MRVSPSKTFGNLLAVMIGFVLLANAIMKMSEDSGSIFYQHYNQIGIVEYLYYFGLVELIVVLIYLIPFLAPIGVLMVSTQIGFDLILGLSFSDSYVFNLIILFSVWVSAYLRNPEMFSGIELPEYFRPQKDEDDW
ncbi:MAG: hypothetical protein K9G44_05365 [Melioribacteraceae bacterium]|nr:hypothetical protein [Melioribacteraceae bacterium]